MGTKANRPRSGDAHIHANYINNELVGVDDIHLQVSGEGLDVANLMVANSGGAIVHDERFFEGKPHAVSRGSRILYWNEEMRNRRLYGHMSFFNLKELVYPLYTGFPGTPGLAAVGCVPALHDSSTQGSAPARDVVVFVFLNLVILWERS